MELTTSRGSLGQSSLSRWHFAKQKAPPHRGLSKGLCWRQKQVLTMRSPSDTNWGQLALREKDPNSCRLTAGAVSHAAQLDSPYSLFDVNNYKYTRYNLAYAPFFGKSHYTNYQHFEGVSLQSNTWDKFFFYFIREAVTPCSYGVLKMSYQEYSLATLGIFSYVSYLLLTYLDVCV